MHETGLPLRRWRLQRTTLRPAAPQGRDGDLADGTKAAPLPRRLRLSPPPPTAERFALPAPLRLLRRKPAPSAAPLPDFEDRSRRRLPLEAALRPLTASASRCPPFLPTLLCLDGRHGLTCPRLQAPRKTLFPRRIPPPVAAAPDAGASPTLFLRGHPRSRRALPARRRLLPPHAGAPSSVELSHISPIAFRSGFPSCAMNPDSWTQLTTALAPCRGDHVRPEIPLKNVKIIFPR